MNCKRDSTKKITVRGVNIGGGAPVTVQSMCNTKTWDVESTVAQIEKLRAAGCDIVRIAVPDMKSAEAVSSIREKTDMPLVADIHFDWRLALECAARGIDKIRINPGNIGSEEKVEAVARACADKGIPVRIGVNAGSLEKDILAKYGRPCAEALVESAAGHVRLLEKYDFTDICISMKASSVPLTIEAYRLAAEMFPYPLHVGVTETGTEYNGVIRSAVGIGTILSEGIGNTIRVSLTADPVREVIAGLEILRAAGLRKGGPRLVACPTCGRTEIDLISLASQVEQRLKETDRDITVAVMGCVVNGPGEAREADYGVAGGKGKGLLFKKGEVLGTYPYNKLCDALMDLIKQDER
ncbi:MAG: flavodoxin-dependent (E)-4-hydroxy-3-methylbut-2-enyl-diphosphate synthase [Oscillospiraceae bacterium]|nr:flavodoxin-dependent (E)-4-hydroxy-3-methylbut-2-enyl-diphosphate synthase [Oscillospiraceae bacterium]